MKKEISAILCDLDGVITQTATLHAKSWKQLFDPVLSRQASQGHYPYQEFIIEKDYPEFIDGKPRLEGIKSFLMARHISVPEGNEADDSEKLSIYGLAEKKNLLFHELLKKEGVDVIVPTVNTLKSWKAKGLKLAVVSSSKNCMAVLEAAGLKGFFEVIVDGITAEANDLKGKPEADTFLSASEELDLDPGRCAVVEDSAVGVEASRRGGFGLTIGIINMNNVELLSQAGADVILPDLSYLAYTGFSLRYPQVFAKIPDAFSHERSIWNQIHGKKIFFFFDYDGTLTPIVSRPENALLSEEVRSLLGTLADLSTVVIISGRDLKDIKEKVGLRNIFYAGSHGYEIEGPEGTHLRYEAGLSYLPIIRAITIELQDILNDIPGVQIEQKKFAVAVHYRNVPEGQIEKVRMLTSQAVGPHKDLIIGKGKMVLEVRPAMEWDKGKAVDWITSSLNAGPKDFYVYAGDDMTDEDAFKGLYENSIGFLVGSAVDSYADYVLKNTDETKELIKRMIKNISRI